MSNIKVRFGTWVGCDGNFVSQDQARIIFICQKETAPPKRRKRSPWVSASYNPLADLLRVRETLSAVYVQDYPTYRVIQEAGMPPYCTNCGGVTIDEQGEYVHKPGCVLPLFAGR